MEYLIGNILKSLAAVGIECPRSEDFENQLENYVAVDSDVQIQILGKDNIPSCVTLVLFGSDVSEGDKHQHHVIDFFLKAAYAIHPESFDWVKEVMDNYLFANSFDADTPSSSVQLLEINDILVDFKNGIMEGNMNFVFDLSYKYPLYTENPIRGYDWGGTFPEYAPGDLEGYDAKD